MTAQTLAERIRPLKARKSRSNRRTDLTGRALAAIAHREQVESVVQPYLDTLRDALPELWPRRRLYDGAWVIGLEADLPSGSFKGRPYRAYSRLEFAIRIDLSSGCYTVNCATTTFDRDAEPDSYDGSLQDGDDEALAVFVEHHCLLFATRFFEQAPRSQWRDEAA